VLDVGCGLGLNGAAARRRGAHVTGIDRAPQAAAAARLDEVLEVDVESDASCERALGAKRFDLILFGDVLEHTREPARVLGRLLRHLDDEGRVIVSLPNVAAWTVRLALLRGRFDYEASGILDRTHLRFFTRQTAVRLVEDAGLEVLRVDENPMLVRAAARKLVLDRLARADPDAPDDRDPTALARSRPYALYQRFVRPLEDQLARRAPGLLAFQHVVVARHRPRPRRLTLTVGMLTRDEEGSIERMIAEIRRAAPDARILCVDGSTRDRTAERAASLGAEVLRQLPPRGHGPAMALLLRAAASRSDALIYLDCDLTYPTDEIPRLRRLLEEEAVDVVNAVRTRRRPAAMPLANYLANRGFAALARVGHGVPTCDLHSGMRAYRSSVIRAFDALDGWAERDALPVETLLWPARSGYRVVEVPIAYRERVGESKLERLSGTAWTLARLARTLASGERPGARYEVR
jgi:SAM-dependent methyltransferase